MAQDKVDKALVARQEANDGARANKAGPLRLKVSLTPAINGDSSPSR